MTVAMTQLEAEREAQDRLVIEANEKLVEAIMSRIKRENEQAKPPPGFSLHSFGKGIMSSISGAGSAMSGFMGGLPGAAMGALESAMGGAAKALNTWNDSSLSTEQKMRRFGEGLPVVGGLVKSFNSLVDAMTGLEDQFRRDAIKRQEAAMRAGIEGGILRQRMALGVNMAGMSGFAGALAGLPGAGLVGGDRNTVSGQFQYERERLLAPILFQRDLAESRVSGARDSERAAWLNERQARGGLLGLRQDREDLLEQLEGTRSRKAISRITTGIAGVDEGIAQARTTHEAAINELKAKGLELAQRQSEVRKADIGIARAELSLLEQKEQRLHSQLSLFGNMTRGQRNMAVRAVNRIERVGWDAAGPAARQLAMQLNGDKAAILAKQAAEASGIMDRLPGEWRREGTRAGLDSEVREKDRAIRELVRLDEQKLAERMSNVMGGFAEKIAALMSTAVSDAIEKMRNMIRNSNNQK